MITWYSSFQNIVRLWENVSKATPINVIDDIFSFFFLFNNHFFSFDDWNIVLKWIMFGENESWDEWFEFSFIKSVLHFLQMFVFHVELLWYFFWFYLESSKERIIKVFEHSRRIMIMPWILSFLKWILLTLFKNSFTSIWLIRTWMLWKFIH